MNENKETSPGEDKLEQYIKDIELIRQTLESEEDLLLMKPWVLISWGVWILVGMFFTFLLRDRGFSQHKIYLTVWFPVILVGGLFEAVAWLIQAKDESIPLFTKRIGRWAITATGTIASFMILLWFFLDHPVPLAGPVLLATSVVLFLYCHFTFHDAYPEALFIFGSGLVFIFGGFKGLWPMVYAGAAPAAAMIEAGIRYMIRERRREG